MKNTALAAFLAVVILLAVGRLFWVYGSQPEPGEPVAHMMPAACEACGKNYAASVGKQPAKCLSCGERALYRAFKCLNPECNAIFPYKEAGQSVQPADTKCPKCGGGDYTTELAPEELGKP